MDLNWIDDLLSLTETRSFSRSADARHIAQSTFSKRIRALEEWVGAELVDRRRYPVELTAAGLLVASCGRDVSRKLSDMKSLFQPATGRRPTVRIAAGHVLASHFLPAWWRSGTVQLTQAHMSVYPANIHESALALIKGECDLLLAYHHDVIGLGLDTDAFEAIDVGDDFVVPVSVPAAGGAPLHKLPGSRMNPANVVQYSKGAFFHRVVSHILDTTPLTTHLHTRCESDMVEVVKALALAGNGMAWLPRSCVARELAEGSLLYAGGGSYEARLAIRCWRSRTRHDPIVDQVFQGFRRN